VSAAAIRASALAFVKYKFVLPSLRSSVSAAAIRASALASVKYKLDPSVKLAVVLVPSLVSNVLLKSAVANLVAIEFVIVVLKLASSPSADASSFNVSSVLGALSTSASTLSCALASALASV